MRTGYGTYLATAVVWQRRLASRMTNEDSSLLCLLAERKTVRTQMTRMHTDDLRGAEKPSRRSEQVRFRLGSPLKKSHELSADGAC
jgi:hypothetical protein